MEVESFCLIVVGESFDIVVQNVPGHVFGVEIFSPRFECWSPEVHHDGLRFVSELNRGVILCDSTHLLVVNRPGDKVWSPGQLVDVPVILRVKVYFVVVGFSLCLAVAVNHIH